MKHGLITLLIFLALAAPLTLSAEVREGSPPAENITLSDHFNGTTYFNPGVPPTPAAPGRSRSSWIWRWIFGSEWPAWPEITDASPGPRPAVRVPKGSLVVTPVGHATFLIQMDGLNILTDPIWSDRCSPVSWAGPRRHREPGLGFADLPPIDALLISHNHYDHLDLPTLERLAKKGAARAVVPLGNLALVRDAGISRVDELDWWQSVRLSSDVTTTLVPAQHFSSRTLWDRNQTLWGGFVLSGPSGNIYFAGDTGYGPHFRQIAQRFPGIRMALLPIAPFRPRQSGEAAAIHYPGVHMGPDQAVQAHLDLGAEISLASHFQVFQLGADGFDDAVNELAWALRERGLKPEVFMAPTPGRALELTQDDTEKEMRLSRGEAAIPKKVSQ